MSKNPMRGPLAIALLFAAGFAGSANAQVNPAQILAIKPKYDDVAYSTPAPAEVADCKVQTPKSGSGYILTDGKGLTLRKFLDTDGDNRVDTWSFFKDGAEVYRESIAGGKYYFRWIGAGGMKWAIGTLNPAGNSAVVEGWKFISAEEAAQEAFQALKAGDFERMKTLLITPAEIQALGLPAVDAQKLLAQVQAAPATFQKVRAANANLATATFARLENAQPGSFPADVTGGTQDLVKITRGLILFENQAGAKKHDWILAQEMIQVGNVWRMTNIPSPDIGGPGEGDGNEALAKLMLKLHEIDKMAQTKGLLGKWIRERYPVVQEIATKVRPEERINWHKQICDNLATAIVDGDDALLPILTKWKEQFIAAQPGGTMAAYSAYREIWATHQAILNKVKPAEYPKKQEEYHQALAKFVTDYPTADDAPDAILTIAMGADFAGRDDEAKKWYGQIVKNFATSTNAPKAAGAIERIDSVGKAFSLKGLTLGGEAYLYQPRAKATVVYYWGSFSAQSVGDFAMLKKLQTTFGKDLEVVTVNCDDTAAAATAFVQQNGLNAPHLHEASKDGGMNGRLAMQYGIFGLPHVFLVDGAGKVVSSKLQVGALEDEISKLTKK